MPAAVNADRRSTGLPRPTRKDASRRARLVSAIAVALAGVLVLAPTASAFFGPETAHSPNAHEINVLYYVTLAIGLVIFFSVEIALGYALIRYRDRKGAVAAQIRGNTRLELTWTLGAALILVVLAIITFAKLSSIVDPANSTSTGAQLSGESGMLASDDLRLPPNRKALRIDVTGQQFVWRYTYPATTTNPDGLGAVYSYETMVVPVGTTVVLDIQSIDVVHSWWIPELGGKFQAVPGYNNYTWFRVDKPGIYRGQCAEICGRGHARMIAQVDAVSPSQFEAWLSRQKREISQANAHAAAGRAKLDSQTGPAQVLNP